MEPKKCLDNPNYLVYPDGRIWSTITNKEISQWTKGDGYLNVSLQGKNYLVHRLVAECFIPNPENKTEVNHKDRNRQNNHIDNLEWVTHQENMDYSRTKRSDCQPVEMINSQTLQVEQTFPSLKEAERQTNIGYRLISNVLNGKQKTAGGYLWRKCEMVDNPREKE